VFETLEHGTKFSRKDGRRGVKHQVHGVTDIDLCLEANRVRDRENPAIIVPTLHRTPSDLDSVQLPAQKRRSGEPKGEQQDGRNHDVPRQRRKPALDLGAEAEFV